MSIKKTILIIDDSKSVQQVLKHYLEDFGEYFDFKIFCASDGEEGLKYCNSKIIDFILLDMVMPKMNGIVFLKRMRDIPKLKNIPVIVISSISNNQIIRNAIMLGANAYLLKPVNLLTLKKVVYEHCNLKFHIPDSVNKGRSEVYFKDDIIIAEIHNSFEQMFINAIKHKLHELAAFSKNTLKRFLIMFISIPENELTENVFLKLLTFYQDIKGMSQENIKVITNSAKIKKLIFNNENTENIEIVDSLINGMQKLNLQLLQNQESTIKLDFIKSGMILFSTLYDQKGDTIKNKGEAFTDKDIEELREKDITTLYYVKLSDDDKSIMESPLLDISEIELPENKGFLIK
jgi:CheY-like chemotaxis protein